MFEKITAEGRKVARDTHITYSMVCPHCKNFIFTDGLIKQLSCPECKGLLMLSFGKLVQWEA